MSNVTSLTSLGLSKESTSRLMATIKLKLTEYGAYVDDELPDYIMVMLSNKKTVNSIKSDLQLFLNENTDTFIAWLFEYLKALQQKESFSSASQSAAPPRPTVATVTNFSAGVPSFERHEAIEKPVTTVSHVIISVPSAAETLDVSQSIEKPRESRKLFDVVPKPSLAPANKPPVPSRPPATQEVSGRTVRESLPSTDHSRSDDVRSLHSDSRSRRAGRGGGSQLDVHRRRRSSGGHGDDGGSRGRSRSRDRSRSPSRSRSRSRDRSRRRPTAGRRTKRDSWKSDEEEKAKVSSVVKVTPRRNALLPPRLAPNKNLLMRAVHEAHASVQQFVERSRFGAEGKSAVAAPVEKEKPQEKAFGLNATAAPRKEEMVELEKEEGEVEEAEATEDRMEDGEVKERSEGLVDTKFIVTLNGRGDKELLRHLEQVAEGEEEDGEKTSPAIHRASNDLRFTLTRQPVGGAAKETKSFAERRKALLLSMNRRTEHLKQIRQAQMLKQRLVQKSINAADAVEAVEDKKDELMSEESPQDVEMEEKNDDGEDQAAQVNERCRFWPNCLNKECPYIHPSQPCRNFPACKFGPSCLFVHPKCRYDAMCSRFDCSFQHSTPRPVDFAYAPPVAFIPPPRPAGGMIRCRFYPNCQNKQCQFFHPNKPCRFGVLCSAKDTCLFEHPAAPDRNLFKWTKYSASSIKAPTMPTSESNVGTA